MREVLNEWTYRKARSTLRKAGSPHQASELAASVAGYEAIKVAGGLSLDLASFEDLGSALVKARIARGWSQEQLARKLGMPKQQVQRYEASMYASVSLSRIPKIADALGLSFTGTVKSGSPPNRSSDLARMLAGFTAAEAVQAVERRLRLRGLKEVEARGYLTICARRTADLPRIIARPKPMIWTGLLTGLLCEALCVG